MMLFQVMGLNFRNSKKDFYDFISSVLYEKWQFLRLEKCRS